MSSSDVSHSVDRAWLHFCRNVSGGAQKLKTPVSQVAYHLVWIAKASIFHDQEKEGISVKEPPFVLLNILVSVETSMVVKKR